MSGFSFDKDAFNRQVQSGVTKALEDQAQDAQPKFDQVFDAHANGPVETIIPVLRSALAEIGWTPSDEQLRSWAEFISRGVRVVMQAQWVGMS